MQHRRLGRSGEPVSILGLGGFHLSRPEPAEAARIMHAAIDHGITFFDNCWDYAEGESERRMGEALAGRRRDQVFLMTKIDGRTAEAATRQIEESLRRLRTDHVDLLQIHEVIHADDPDRVFSAGCYDALLRAREQGKTRFLGFTGHKSGAIHTAMLESALRHGWTPDAVQMPLNVMDAHRDDGFERIVLPLLLQHDIGVLGMKPMGDPFILDSGTVSAPEALRYTMSLPTSVTITGIDSMPILQQALDVLRDFRPFSPAERDALLARTAQASQSGAHEKYKNSDHFDGTVKNPEWLG
ncbi:MAG TPA: aldo/keto reductase [Acetobacteraceae bacterium]|nr:aldo/keto reductase [Acetobacteraceae bacterium]